MTLFESRHRGSIRAASKSVLQERGVALTPSRCLGCVVCTLACHDVSFHSLLTLKSLAALLRSGKTMTCDADFPAARRGTLLETFTGSNPVTTNRGFNVSIHTWERLFIRRGFEKPLRLGTKSQTLHSQQLSKQLPVLLEEVLCKIELWSTPGGKFVAKGTILISNVRIVFVASESVGHIIAFDLPLLYIHEEKFNQPIFFCNSLTGKCHPVVPNGENASLYGVYNFKILFKEGGVGTFVPLFFNLLRSVRGREYEIVQPSAPPMDPLPSEQAPVDEMIRHAYVDPNDPTRLYLQQPFDAQPSLRRRIYKASLPEEGQL